MTEVAVPRWLFTAILQRIGRLRVSPNPAGVAGGTLPVRSRSAQHGIIMRTTTDRPIR